MSDELSAMIQGFVEDSHEAFDSIESDLLSFESNPKDTTIINSIFRVMHTIKGTAGFLGLNDIQELAHSLETIFDSIRSNKIQINVEVMDYLLDAIDLLKLMVFELIEIDKSEYHLKKNLDYLNTISIGKVPERNTKQDIQYKISESEEELEEESGFEITPAILKDFVLEAEEHLITIEQNLLLLEGNPNNKESIDELFRAIHSIKGTADYVRLKKITTLAHKIETLVDQLRKNTLIYDNNIADILLKSTDLLRTLVFMIKMGDNDNVILIDETLNKLNSFIEPSNASEIEDPQPPPISENTADPKIQYSDEAFKAFINITEQQLIILEELGKEIINNTNIGSNLPTFKNALQTIRNVAKNINEEKVISACETLEKITDLLTNKTPFDEIKKQFIENFAVLLKTLRILRNEPPESPLLEKCHLMLENISVEEKSKTSKNDTPNSQPSNELKTMRVEASRLDTFMNLVGELIITRNSFLHIINGMNIHIPQPLLIELKTIENLLNRISDDLQTTLMEMRLVPIKTVFQKIPRIVRDIARKTNKKIEVQMIGENTEIDKSIVELIGDPLVHIIRNSCDHGIETTEKRLLANKPETGIIILKASHLGSAIRIDIIDDGSGINIDKVKEIALEKNLTTAHELSKMDDKTIQNFIFKPGFSTAKEVTDLSGRGVGMDVVLTNIQKVHGTVEIESQEGTGSTVKMLLPLTLAVIDTLIVRHHNQKYAIPLEAVKETIEVEKYQLQYLKQKEAIELREEIIGVSRLENLFEIKTADQPQKIESDILSIVFLEIGNKKIGIVVDELYTQQEIVVKPLQSYLKQIPGIKGSTILGDGEVILILEPTELIELASK